MFLRVSDLYSFEKIISVFQEIVLLYFLPPPPPPLMGLERPAPRSDSTSGASSQRPEAGSPESGESKTDRPPLLPASFRGRPLWSAGPENCLGRAFFDDYQRC